ncbi:MAG: HEAT repeat domain-containing protein [Anaerolineales bacterium]|nr:HEAT repeat domain-containing protein [Anaerolineales bacterium]
MDDPLAELVCGDDQRAERAVSALAADEAFIPRLLELLNSQNDDERWWAIRALAASPHARTGSFISALSDSSPEVRAAAALALIERPSEEALSALMQRLDDDDSLTAELAAKALVKIGKAAFPSLVKAAHSGKQNVRILALRALTELRDMRAVPVLMACLEEDSAALAYWAQVGLERLGLDTVYLKP